MSEAPLYSDFRHKRFDHVPAQVYRSVWRGHTRYQRESFVLEKYSRVGSHKPANLWPVRISVRADHHQIIFHRSFRTNRGAILEDILAPNVIAVLIYIHGPGGMARSQGIPLGGASPSPLCILVHYHYNLRIIL